jgi:asparagine synthase (glutamine-hydrolysing)
VCGIAGSLSSTSDPSTNVERMLTALAHRGPDGRGIVKCDEGVVLGHTRLSIIDIEDGSQPMCSPNGKQVLTFNGEIYGYETLRKNYPNYKYKTRSDTELLLAMYAEHGEAMLEKLPGMFAFAIWDSEKRKLFCARDRFGEKPLYYSTLPDKTFVFSSEIKSILAGYNVNRKVDKYALSHYAQYGYVQPSLTIFENIKVLPPGHFLSVKLDEPPSVRQYWSLPNKSESEWSISDAVESFTEKFQKAVESQLVADVPVGAFLSGGADSTTVVAACMEMNQKIKTYSFGYPGPSSELPIARESAQFYNTDHYELRESEFDLLDGLLDLAKTYDEPFSDSSALPLYKLCQFASETVKVALTGDGADELLGGYTWWYQPLLQMQASRDWSSARKFVTFLLASGEFIHQRSNDTLGIQGSVSRTNRDNFHALKYSANLKRARKEMVNVVSNRSIKKLGLPVISTPNFAPSIDTLDDVLRLDLEDYLPGDILVKTDRASMAHGLELRSPFLDVDFASFCISLPLEFKVTSTRDKILLREAYSAKWPEQVKNKPKQGFGVTNNDWVNDLRIKECAKELFQSTNSKLFDLVDYKATNQLITDNPGKIMNLLILGLWANEYC